jgi:hypothetical protein
MRLRTQLKLFLMVAVAAFIYGGYLFNEDVWGRKWQPADAILPDNVKYYGEIKNGLLEGPGELHGADGRRYKGNFHRGLMEGQGEYRDWNAQYRGAFSRGMFNGPGELIYHDGVTYIGEFKDGRMHGQGKLIFPSGGEFEGVMVDDAMHKGILREASGGIYEGEFKDGVFHGKGIYTNADGDRFEGEFVNGALTGKGIVQYASGERYEGELLEWHYHGQGIFTDDVGNVFAGEFVEGALTGKGRIEYADGRRYEGDLVEWTFEGQGRYVDEEGNIYTGAFSFDRYHGEGTLQLKTPVEGVTELKGEWVFGRFPKDPRNKHQDPAPMVEKALYAQSALLQESAARLQPQDPQKIDFYFLGMAGDGTQALFQREIQYVNQVVAEALDTGGRQLLLVNNSNTVEQYPLATTTALSQSIAALSRIMDVSQDILLIYLTSHGSEDHKFHIDMPGMTLPSLSKKAFASILNESGIQWRVIIISACYSGGFIPELQNPHTLVITAAREDRKSFGCDDSNDMTYFARAYFKESFAANPDFLAAFDNAKVKVAEWEAADFPEDERSEPQIFVGEKIREYLQVWAQQRKSP